MAYVNDFFHYPYIFQVVHADMDYGVYNDLVTEMKEYVREHTTEFWHTSTGAHIYSYEYLDLDEARSRIGTSNKSAQDEFMFKRATDAVKFKFMFGEHVLDLRKAYLDELLKDELEHH